MRTNDFMCSRMMMRISEKKEKTEKWIPRSGYPPMNDCLPQTHREGTVYAPNPATGRLEKAKQ
jgi:hypothetical protein